MYRRIKDCRVDNDYTQETIAAYLAVDQTTYSRYEHGIVEIPVRMLQKLAKLYKVKVDDLIEIEIERDIY